MWNLKEVTEILVKDEHFIGLKFGLHHHQKCARFTTIELSTHR